jgi:hypothetical protein
MFLILPSPQAGIQFTFSISLSAPARRELALSISFSAKLSVKLERSRPSSSFSTMACEREAALSIEMNHCGVARKMTGFLHRQQCG